MSSAGNIRYMAGGEIDREKWDACVSSAPNGLIYGHSFYLDALAGDWLPMGCWLALLAGAGWSLARRRLTATPARA